MMVIGVDGSSLRRAIRRVDQMQKAIDTALSPRQARRIGDFGKDRLGLEVRRFAKNPTGRLEKSWSFRSQRKGDERVIVWVSDRPYARIHDTGGVIRPVRARALTIPVTFVARRVEGGPRKFPGKLNSTPWGLVDLQGTTQYVWASKVRIPRTRYIQKALADTRFFARTDIQRKLKDSTRGRVILR